MKPFSRRATQPPAVQAKCRFWVLVCVLATALTAFEAGAADSGQPPEYLFLGNEKLPPMIYMENNEPVGIVVDIADAVRSRMRRPVRLEFMDWGEAQQLVLDGKADALLQMNPTEARKKIYDFSTSLLESEFCMFTASGREGVYDLTSLRGLRVGVEEKGAPIQLLGREPLIDIVVVPDVVRGFRMLSAGALDAVVVDRWVGLFVIAENRIGNVKISGGAVAKSHSAIAVAKGNAELLAAVNRALAEIRRDGTYAAILAKWEPQEVVFQTREQAAKKRAVLIAVFCVLCVMTMFGAVLLHEIRKRKKVIRDLESALAEVRKLSGLLPICSYCKKIRDDRGYWSRIEAYIEDHSEAQFSHGFCRECSEKHYPGLDLSEDEDSGT